MSSPDPRVPWGRVELAAGSRSLLWCLSGHRPQRLLLYTPRETVALGLGRLLRGAGLSSVTQGAVVREEAPPRGRVSTAGPLCLPAETKAVGWGRGLPGAGESCLTSHLLLFAPVDKWPRNGARAGTAQQVWPGVWQEQDTCACGLLHITWWMDTEQLTLKERPVPPQPPGVGGPLWVHPRGFTAIERPSSWGQMATSSALGS